MLGMVWRLREVGVKVEGDKPRKAQSPVLGEAAHGNKALHIMKEKNMIWRSLWKGHKAKA